MLTILDAGTSWMALGGPTDISAPSLPELIAELYRNRHLFDGDTVYTGETPVSTKSALQEYYESTLTISALAERIVSTVPILANLQSSNNLTAVIAGLAPGEIPEGVDVPAGRIMELQKGWAQIWIALNTPVIVYEEGDVQILEKPVDIIFRRDTPSWIATLDND